MYCLVVHAPFCGTAAKYSEEIVPVVSLAHSDYSEYSAVYIAVRYCLKFTSLSEHKDLASIVVLPLALVLMCPHPRDPRVAIIVTYLNAFL